MNASTYPYSIGSTGVMENNISTSFWIEYSTRRLQQNCDRGHNGDVLRPAGLKSR